MMVLLTSTHEDSTDFDVIGEEDLEGPRGEESEDDPSDNDFISDMVSAPPAVIKVSSQASPEHEGGMDKFEPMCKESGGTWEVLPVRKSQSSASKALKSLYPESVLELKSVMHHWFSESPAVSAASQPSASNRIGLTKPSPIPAISMQREAGSFQDPAVQTNNETTEKLQQTLPRPQPQPTQRN